MLRRLRVENLVLIREAELALAPGLNAITGETGAGKTILAQALGLLLGARADAALVRPGAPEAYVEGELDLPPLDEDDALATVAELRPADADALVLARRVFADGRTRAYAWGRSVAREDVAAAAERVIAMSGQFEQRRLARPSYQVDVLDAFAGAEQLRRRADARAAWRRLREARRRLNELERGAVDARARLDELRALVADARDVAVEDEERLLAERERLRRVDELTSAAAAAAEALAPDDGEGAAALVARAEAALVPVVAVAPELARTVGELRDAGVRLREASLELRSFLESLDVEPGRLEAVEEELERLADLRRRFRAATTAELLERAAAARAELDALGDETDPLAAARRTAEEAGRRYAAVAAALRDARKRSAAPFADAVAAELRGIGMGDGEFRAELARRDASAAGEDEVRFVIRPNPGLPFAPVASSASGGELSRIALAIAAVAGGDTLVFDEIDAGIGGRTANEVARSLRRLAERAQVVVITHLPQIASVADRHFRVEKVPGEPTLTAIEALGEEERRAELERMLGGREFLAQVR
ncbi:MAG: AAA family ATPase [Thermoleophilia bacterium]|nr:AAA family ATPase [Thermoleophilia bacterium]